MNSSDLYPSSISSLVLPSASQSFSRTLTSLKQSTLSIPNRLSSIKKDSEFVSRIADMYHLPLIANERCGSWYISPERKAGSAYFKSTDGHQGQWSFNTRRLNLQVLDIVGRHDGCIIVDSTRRGKSMPDALSKTVPVWCAIMNRFIFQDASDCHELHMPSQVVGGSEHAQIEAKLDGFIEDLKALQLDLESLRRKIRKPLRPLWVTQDSALPSALNFDCQHPIICCTSSHRVVGTEMSEDGYIQGAGDDSEGWSHGLTPATFWRHTNLLMTAPEEDLPSIIEDLVAADSLEVDDSSAVLIKPTRFVFIGASKMLDMSTEKFDCVVTCGAATESEPTSDPKALFKVLNLHCSPGKLGSRALRSELHHLIPFVSSITQGAVSPKILCICPTGKDLSVGVALTIICLYFDDSGAFTTNQDTNRIDKLYIRRRLSWIMASHPSAGPSRSTLQAVNAFLMQRP